MLHDTGAEAGEEHDAEGHEEEVVEAGSILPCSRVVVREGEEFGGVRPCFRQAEVGEEEQRDEVERETCLPMESCCQPFHTKNTVHGHSGGRQGHRYCTGAGTYLTDSQTASGSSS